VKIAVVGAVGGPKERPESRPKGYENGVFNPREQGAEGSAKEFFNTLTPSGYFGE
jgi:hypothetical protein